MSEQDPVLIVSDFTTPQVRNWLTKWVDLVEQDKPAFPVREFLSYFVPVFKNPTEEEDVLSCVLAALIARICINNIAAELVLKVSPNNKKDLSANIECRTKALCSIFLYLKETTDSTLQLCLSGDDLSARILARSVVEACDLAIVLSANEELANEWIEAQDDPRDFWHRNMSGNKLSKRRDSLLRNWLVGVDVELIDYSRFRQDEAAGFSMAVHPSFQAGVMTIFSTLGTVPFETEQKENLSNAWFAKRTLSYLVHSIAPAVQTVLVNAIGLLGIYEAVDTVECGAQNNIPYPYVAAMAVAALLCSGETKSDELNSFVSSKLA